ncbi:unnamed protein product [Closterium sp. NIES-64]|nr:unnamed protein product [Closterium sp. NIES-64]
MSRCHDDVSIAICNIAIHAGRDGGSGDGGSGRHDSWHGLAAEPHNDVSRATHADIIRQPGGNCHEASSSASCIFRRHHGAVQSGGSGLQLTGLQQRNGGMMLPDGSMQSAGHMGMMTSAGQHMMTSPAHAPPRLTHTHSLSPSLPLSPSHPLPPSHPLSPSHSLSSSHPDAHTHSLSPPHPLSTSQYTMMTSPSHSMLTSSVAASGMAYPSASIPYASTGAVPSMSMPSQQPSMASQQPMPSQQQSMSIPSQQLPLVQQDSVTSGGYGGGTVVAVGGGEREGQQQQIVPGAEMATPFPPCRLPAVQASAALPVPGTGAARGKRSSPGNRDIADVAGRTWRHAHPTHTAAAAASAAAATSSPIPLFLATQASVGVGEGGDDAPSTLFVLRAVRLALPRQQLPRCDADRTATNDELRSALRGPCTASSDDFEKRGEELLAVHSAHGGKRGEERRRGAREGGEGGGRARRDGRDGGERHAELLNVLSAC